MKIHDIYLKYKKYKRYKHFNINPKVCDIINPLNIHQSTVFPHNAFGVVIAPSVKIGKNCKIYQYVTIGGRNNKDDGKDHFPIIMDNVTIYSYSSIFGDVIIGSNSIVGTYSLVLDNVPENSMVYGIPAKVMKVNIKLKKEVRKND